MLDKYFRYARLRTVLKTEGFIAQKEREVPMLFDFFHIQIAGAEIWIWAVKLWLVAFLTIPLFLIVRAIVGPGQNN